MKLSQLFMIIGSIFVAAGLVVRSIPSGSHTNAAEIITVGFVYYAIAVFYALFKEDK